MNVLLKELHVEILTIAETQNNIVDDLQICFDTLPGIPDAIISIMETLRESVEQLDKISDALYLVIKEKESDVLP